MILYNALILNEDFKFKKGFLEIKDGLISSVNISDSFEQCNQDDECIDCGGNYILPGLIDIHTHGAVGADHLDGDIESTDKICKYFAKKGTTSLLATIMTQSCENMTRACKNVDNYVSSEYKGAHIRGIYLEGPFFSEKYKGAQHPEYLIDADVDYFKSLNDASDGKVRIISLAPERNGSIDFIEKVNSDKYFKDVSVFVGHTESDYNTARLAFEKGAKGLTHTFNCMTPIHHRNPGVIPAAISNHNVFCECVCDGIHVHPSMISMLYNSIGRERFVTISDSIRPTGLTDGKYTSGGQAVIVENGMAYLDNGNDSKTIAGSTVCLFDCVKNLVKWGLMPLEEAVYSASAVPAKAAGIFDTCGSISVGKSADLLIVDKDYNLNRVFIGQ